MYKKYKDSIKIGNLKKRFIDLSGMKFGKLTISSPYGVDKLNQVIFNCVCDCGEKINLTFVRISRNNLRSCGSCWKNNEHLKGKPARNLERDPRIACLNTAYSTYKSNAKQRQLEFTLTKNEFSNLIFSNCSYCSNQPTNQFYRTKRRYFYNGIDRIDNKIGYIFDNCLTCCYLCNFMKGRLEQKDFLTQIEKIYNNYSSKAQKI